MLNFTDTTVNKRDPSPSLLELAFRRWSHLLKMRLKCARAQIQTQVWWLPGLVLFPLTPELTVSEDIPHMGGTNCPCRLLWGIQGFGSKAGSGVRAPITVEPSLSQPLPSSPASKKESLPDPSDIFPRKGWTEELPQGDFKGGVVLSVLRSKRDTHFLAQVGNPCGFHLAYGRGLLFSYSSGPLGRKSGLGYVRGLNQALGLLGAGLSPARPLPSASGCLLMPWHLWHSHWAVTFSLNPRKQWEICKPLPLKKKVHIVLLIIVFTHSSSHLEAI